MSDVYSDFVHLARLLWDGTPDDVSAIVRRGIRAVIKERPDLADLGNRVLAMANSETTPLRGLKQQSLPVPVDQDSRLELLRREVDIQLSATPIWPIQVREVLESIVDERGQEHELRRAGMSPTRSLLFTGPPGVGKTLASRWLAKELQRPLLTLDLAAVMSSFLGRTGNNIRAVLEYARRSPCVLLLDEFDSIAKRRDDVVEVGELKRLVTVLLQSIDDWPSEGLLIAATNHPGLLDPAVWRRFEKTVEFPIPSVEDVQALLAKLLPQHLGQQKSEDLSLLATILHGISFADITTFVNAARRESIVSKRDIGLCLDQLACRFLASATLESKIQVARRLHRKRTSQRTISHVTGLARDTIRKHVTSNNNPNV